MSRVPPPEVELSFVRNPKGGTVHVVAWTEPEDKPARTEEEILTAIIGRRAMLCGATGRPSVDEAMPGTWLYVDTFPDDALCVRCHRVLDAAGQAARAFEHPQTHEEEGSPP